VRLVRVFYERVPAGGGRATTTREFDPPEDWAEIKLVENTLPGENAGVWVTWLVPAPVAQFHAHGFGRRD